MLGCCWPIPARKIRMGGATSCLKATRTVHFVASIAVRNIGIYPLCYAIRVHAILMAAIMKPSRGMWRDLSPASSAGVNSATSKTWWRTSVHATRNAVVITAQLGKAVGKSKFFTISMGCQRVLLHWQYLNPLAIYRFGTENRRHNSWNNQMKRWW